MTTRLPQEIIAEIDEWRSKNDVPTRAEAIRRLVELGLDPGLKKKRRKRAPDAAIYDQDGNLITKDPKRVGEFMMALAAKEAKGE